MKADHIFMNQKGFVNMVFVVLVVILVGALGYFVFYSRLGPTYSLPGENQKNAISWSVNRSAVSSFDVRKESGKMILYKTYSDGTSQKTGLEITSVKVGTYEVPVNIVVSPDKTKTVFNKWNDNILKTEIYISDIDGRNTRLLTQQEVGEGSGGLNQDSLAWSADGKYITYYESVITCEGGCDPNQPNSAKIYYQVNVATGEKKVISKVPAQ